MFPIPFNFPFRKKDGSITSIDDAISSGGGSYTLPTASADTKGGVKVGAGLTMDGETLKNSNPTPYTLPTASADTKGGVKIGDGLTMDDDVLKAVGGGSSTKIYYKDFPVSASNTFMEQATISNEGSGTSFKIYTSSGLNLAVTDYQPIAAKVIDVYSGYYFMAGLQTTDNTPDTGAITLISSRNPNSGATIIRVYYAKKTDLQSLT